MVGQVEWQGEALRVVSMGIVLVLIITEDEEL